MFQIRYNSARGFLYRETLFLDCYWGAAGAQGATLNDALVNVIFSLSQSGRIRVVGTIGYAIALLGGPITHRKQGAHNADVTIFDITDPLNPILVYSWIVNHREPGGISEVDDTVDLISGRVYALYLVSRSADLVEASSETVGAPAVLSAYSTGSGGVGGVVTIFYEKAASESVSPEIIRSDINGDRCVDDADLLAVLFCLGAIVDVGEDVFINQGCTPADVNMDGAVDDADVLTVLFNLGVCY
ncbi:MAG: hypothetical protein NZM28_02815 [Fimbriimonadales bacterium]|nr:hypothetical protein [Fimbriimonadales bacterium]